MDLAKDQITQKQIFEGFKARGEERPLMRSRSEQDLSDMIRKSKLSDEKTVIEESNDTFRLLGSD